MGKLIQIRDVPEEAHRTLKARAAKEGRTLSAYLRRELVELAEDVTPDEVWERISARPVVKPPSNMAPEDFIRRDRDSH